MIRKETPVWADQDVNIDSLCKECGTSPESAKQLSVTNEQLDKFQSAVADQAIQIMELRALKAVKLSTARDVLKNLDAIWVKLQILSDDGEIKNAQSSHTWLKARQFTSEARDWLAEAIIKADK